MSPEATGASPWTAAWYYVNLPRDGTCTYRADRGCLQGACVSGAIERQLGVLAYQAPDDVRLKALKYAVHLVREAHQPLHSGFAEGSCGNLYQLHAFGRGTNLHNVRDTSLIQQWPGGVDALRVAINAAGAATDETLPPSEWVASSCRVASADGLYPADHKLASDYVQRWNATLVQQLATAGHRLAQVLNKALV